MNDRSQYLKMLINDYTKLLIIKNLKSENQKSATNAVLVLYSWMNDMNDTNDITF